MKKIFGTILSLLGTAILSKAADPIFINTTTLVDPPQIDALAFLNIGEFTLSGGSGFSVPYDFQSVLSYTNSGFMKSQSGFRFDNTDSSGIRRPSDHFINQRQGVIDAGFPLLTLPERLTWPSINVSAKSLVNRGRLSSDPIGVINLSGDTVDLGGGIIDIRSLIGYSNHDPSAFLGIFDPEISITDQFWGLGEVGTPLAGVVSFGRNGITAATPTYRWSNGVVNAQGELVAFPASLNLRDVIVHTLTSNTSPTNHYVQSVFIQNVDTNFLTSVTFHATDPSNPMKAVLVNLATTETNDISGRLERRDLFILDTTAVETNFVVLSNTLSQTSFRPATIQATRVLPTGLPIGASSNTILTNGDIFVKFTGGPITNGVGFSNAPVVTNAYAAYSFNLNDPNAPVTSPGDTPSSLIGKRSGRVSVDSKSLNLERAVIHAEGAVTLKTDHLVSTVGAKIDAPQLYYDLGSTNGRLELRNIAKPQVSRLNGNVRVYSGVWTNFIEVTVTNAPAGGGTEGGTDAGTTETIRYEKVFHVLYVLNSMTRVQQTEVTALRTRAAHVSIPDNLNVSDLLSVDAEDLTINGRLRIANNVPSWTATNFPNLLYLTNNGTISAQSNVRLGSDRLTPYSVIDSAGTVEAAGIFVKTLNLNLKGRLTTGGRTATTNVVQIEASNANFEGGAIEAGGDVSIKTGSARFSEQVVNTVATVTLDISGALANPVVSKGTRITNGYGLSLISKPSSGDFLGSTFVTASRRIREAIHVWAGDDRGASPAGFQNNAAVGQWVLSAEEGAILRFSPTGAKGALYVDSLIIGTNMLDRLAEFVDVSDDFTIYFGCANVAAEKLDGSLNGKIRWVKDYAGPYSGIEMPTADGGLILVNKALRDSATIDSDGDGVPNASDPSPFPGVSVLPKLSFTADERPKAVVQWQGAGSSAYDVEVSEKLVEGAWKSAKSFTNRTLLLQPFRYEEAVDAALPARYFRLRERSLPNK